MIKAHVSSLGLLDVAFAKRTARYGWSGFGLLDFLGGLLFVVLKDKIDLVVVIQLKNGGEFASCFGYEIIEWTNPSFFNQFVDFFDRQSSAGYALGDAEITFFILVKAFVRFVVDGDRRVFMKLAFDSLKLVVFSTKSTVIFEISCMNCSRVISFSSIFRSLCSHSPVRLGLVRTPVPAASRN